MKENSILDLTKLKPRHASNPILDDNPLVSVVVPCYNVSEYIDQCLNSILNNGYRNIELICIDDRSTDSTVDHIRKLMKKDKRVRLFWNELDHNIYGGGCRNIGLEHASGKYVYFCDSDDYILPGLISECVARCEELDAEICCFRHKRLDVLTNSFSEFPASLKTHYLLDPGKRAYGFNDVCNIFNMTFSGVWDKFYNRAFLDKIGAKFQEIKNSNDCAFSNKTMAHASKVTFIDRIFYVYRTNIKTSVQSDLRNGNNLKNVLASIRQSHEYVKEIGSERLMEQFKQWVYTQIRFVKARCKNISPTFALELASFLESAGMLTPLALNVLTKMVFPYDVILSFATHGKRLQGTDIYEFLNSIVHQKTEFNYHVVANVYRQDWNNMPRKLRHFMETNNIEVLVSDFNWKPHLKYIMSMKKYQGIPVITVDDDCTYRDDMVQLLYSNHLQNPNVIIGGKCRDIQFDVSGNALGFETWPLTESTDPKIDTMPIGYGGVLYPSWFTRLIGDYTEKEVLSMGLLTKDDFYLHWLATKNKMPSKLVSLPENRDRNLKLGSLVGKILGCSQDEDALFRKNLVNNENNLSIGLFNHKV